ncbi:hypothetical protein MGEO_20780 [Marivita geojedonensis]|uniref:Uncharacterized protein n=1 Tax=Marivita geojedonensis TaxID=1123756 RepID=A0A1X4N7E0_9RHOB|nr:hypothetical protein MGEO_20780 [Marivita geojedonensis]PRY70752.1 hypothetical protein CLV76_1521 [Marivita geojedonensis]
MHIEGRYLFQKLDAPFDVRNGWRNPVPDAARRQAFGRERLFKGEAAAPVPVYLSECKDGNGLRAVNHLKRQMNAP